MAEGTDQAEQLPPQEGLVEEKGEEKSEHLELQPEQETMRCVVLTGYGGYNKLEVQKYAKPKPMKGQVVVRVHAWQVYFLSFFTIISPFLLWTTILKHILLYFIGNSYYNSNQRSKKLFKSYEDLIVVGGAVNHDAKNVLMFYQ